ncbi:iron ABC transporter permease [Corallococcus sp. H22C18031201]|uniref:FecCD family ABC transporter permease n=1 Tax=Citreicoccus inhibens TaxID=2849499 RepID=UPI000E765E90|nr:iron ABC transporter permease [Citreicoccus inhibens]MBU8895599.1 iron ABC transporter permease [Citreicoccus inhibens]RJS22384.1 iron ABC transporter permease [Corallococcus sp. H22C18031201]
MFHPARLVSLLLAFTLLALSAFAVAARFGERPISLVAALTAPRSTDAVIFFSLRLPRALLAAIVGAGLAASGTTLQGLLRNPLADPFVLGVSGGAALGATLALAFGLSTVGVMTPGMGDALVRLSAPSVFAFLGAGAAILFVLASSSGHAARAPYAALLTGVVFNSFASAAITLVKTLSDPNRLGAILFWLAGSLNYEHGATLAFAALLQVGAIAVMWALAGRLNLLGLGDDDAATLGVPVAATRRWLLLASSASVAGAVALTGLIGFVGLIVPHLLRLAFGPDQRLLIPTSALGGAAFLMLADLLARLSIHLFGSEIPTGVVTALLGGPLFLVLLRRRMRLDAL